MHKKVIKFIKFIKSEYSICVYFIVGSEEKGNSLLFIFSERTNDMKFLFHINLITFNFFLWVIL